MEFKTSARGARNWLWLALLVLVPVAGCAGNRPESDPAAGPTEVGAPGFDFSALPDTVADWPTFKGGIHREGRLYVGGQPDEEALTALPGRGVTAVVNLRTPSEMEDREKVPFDEAALVDSLGLEYITIPLGGKDHPYTPAAVDSLAAALDGHRGPVLLHCLSGGRASNLWAAYLVRFQGFDVSEAYARGRTMGIRPSPLGGLLDLDLKLVVDNP